MSRLYSSHRIVKVLLGNGFVFVSQKGSHQKYKFGKDEVFKEHFGGYLVLLPILRKKFQLEHLVQ